MQCEDFQVSNRKAASLTPIEQRLWDTEKLFECWLVENGSQDLRERVAAFRIFDLEFRA